jgi:hypothetical protein
MFAARQALLARFAVVAAGIAMLAALTGCNGTSTPGEEVPKRALDPRSEALRYFPSSTEAVTLTETSDEQALESLDMAMGRSTQWVEARDRLTDSLSRAGIGPTQVLELSRQPAVEIDLPQPEIAAGTVPGSGQPRSRLLIVLPTEQGVELDRLFRQAAESGGLEVAGNFDDARLYRGPDLDFAVRDGVLVAADGLDRVQQAIARRDGDRQFQLDDAPVTALLNQLPSGAGFHAYSGKSRTTEAIAELIGDALNPGSDPGGSDAEAFEPEEAAFTLREEAGRLNIELIVRLAEASDVSGGSDEEEEPADADEPQPVSITAAALDRALADLPPESPLRLLKGLAPFAGAAWIDGDTMRARLITPR